MSLALRLGYASPRRMLEDMQPHELGMWVAYYGMDPWDEQRSDLRAGVVATAIHAAMGSKRKDHKPIKPIDFLLFGIPEEAPPDPLTFMRQRLGHMVRKKGK